MGPTVSTSVVFTDLVGSTEQSSRVGPDESEELRQVHFGLLRGALAQAGGTEVKNLGDGLMIVFPSVGAALGGAVAMQQTIERRNRRARERLSVRIGVSSGDAVVEDGDYFGETVVEAARLCSLAQGGEILATEVTSILGRSSGHEFEPVGDLELKGLPRPVPAVRVLWSLDSGEAQVPFPSRLEAAVTAGRVFVGRAEEMSMLDDALHAAESGEQPVLFIAGEPGVGKTAMVAEFARNAHQRGTVVLYGRCDEELAVPYQPWVEAVGHLVDHAPESLLRRHIEANGTQLSRLVPQLSGRTGAPPPPGTDPETERYLMFQSVCSILDSAADERPLLIVLDDLHWSDAPTLALLRHIVTTPKSAPPLIIATYRDTDVGRSHPLIDTLATLRRHPGFRRLSLAGLGDGDVAELLEARSGQTLTAEGVAFARSLRQETNGNPFFAREILRNLAESGDLARNEEGRWGFTDAIDPARLPESVLEVVRQRVDRLGADVHRALSAASVIGRDFDLTVLSHVLDEPDDTVLDVLERAVAASVIEEVDGVEDRFTFTHALAQHTMESELSAARRRRCHRRIAEAIEDLWPGDPGERVGELAGHWLAATAPVDSQRAIHYSHMAGERALEALAPDEALRWFGSALELLDESHEPDLRLRCGLLVSLGTAQKQAGVPDYRETLLEAAGLARRVGDDSSLVAAALINNRGYHSNSGETDHERLEVIRAALAVVGEADSAERALLIATLCAESNLEESQSTLQGLADDALAMARRLGDERTMIEVTSRTRVAVYFLETIGDRFDVYAESRRLADRVADPVVCFHAAQALLWAAAARADMATFDDQLETMSSISERTGQPILSWLTRYTQAMRAAIAGDVQSSERLAEQALELGTASGQPDALTFYGGQLMRVRLMQGRLDELSDLLQQLARETEEFPVFRSVWAVACAQSGDMETARSLLESAMREGFDGTHEMQWATAMTMWTEASVRLDHREAAAALYPLLLPFASLTAFTGLTYGGPLAHHLGELAVLLGDEAGASEHFGRASEVESRTGDVYMQSVTHLGRARLLLRRDRSGGWDDRRLEPACEEIAAARDLARPRGFALVDRDAELLLRSIRS